MSDFFVKMLGWIIRLVAIVSGIVSVLIWISGEFVDLITGLADWMLQELSELSAPDWHFSISDHADTLSLVNTFFPLAESFALLLAGIPFIVFIVILRFIKSWIPKINN